MRILDLIIKDLVQILKDRRSLLFLIAMPVVFTLFMGFAYRSGEDGEPQDMRMSLAWVEAEQSSGLSQVLYDRLVESQLLKVAPMKLDAALESLDKGDVDGVLVIPTKFGERVGGVKVSDHPTQNLSWQIKLISDPGSTTGQSLYQLLRAPVAQLMSAMEIGRISAEAFDDPAEFEPSFELAWEKWGENRMLSLVEVERAVKKEAESWFGDNPYNQASPGILVQFAIMGLVTTAQILVRERKSRTLQRLITTAMKPWEILVGHMLAMFAIVFLQTLMLVIFGQLILGVDYLREPGSILLVSAALGLWVASMGLLIGLLAKEDDQVVLYAMIAMFVFSALGGTWFSLEAAGGIFASFGKALPSAWAMRGLQNVLIRGLGLEAAWLPAGILSAYALGFLGLAVWRFRRMEV